MIEFRTLRAKNFGCFKSVELSLARQGLVLILGDNQDTAAASSNGAGKTTLFKALSWVLFGRTVDGLKGDQVILHKANTVTVSLNFLANKKVYLVTRIKRLGKSEVLRLEYIKRKRRSLGANTLKEAQVEIERLLGLDWLTFKNTVLYGQGDIAHFADPRTTDSQRKAVLTRILRLEDLELARIEARKRKRKASDDHIACESEIASLETLKQSLGTDDLEASAKQWEVTQAVKKGQIVKQAKDLKAELASITETKKQLEIVEGHQRQVKETLAGFRALEQERKALAEQREQFLNCATDFKYKVTRLHELQQEVLNHVAKLNAGECPLCGTPSSSLYLIRKRKGLEQEGEQHSKKAETIKLLLEVVFRRDEQVVEQIDAIDKWLANKEALQEKANKLTRQTIELQAVVEGEPRIKKMLGDVKARLRQLQDEPNPYRKQANKLKKQAAELKESIESKTEELEALKEQYSIWDFWVNGFGPAGLPSYLLDSVVPVIAARANKYLEILTDGDLKVELSTLTALKSGSVRDQMTLTASIEGIEGAPMSGGQLKKVTLACDLALMDLLVKREGAAVDLLLLDEVLDGLDSTGKARIMELLEYLRAQRSTILVISHDPEIVEKFSKTITVVKRRGVAQLELAA